MDSVGKKGMAKLITVCKGECPAAEGRMSSGPVQKAPLSVTEPFFYLQLLEATHPNLACLMPSHRPFEEGSQAAQMQSLAPYAGTRR